MPTRLARLWLPACLWLAAAPAARGDDFYYVLVFGSQTPRPCAKYSHTFATFVRATGRGPCAEAYALEFFTISWLPETGEIRVAALLAERGRNLDLGETLRWVAGTGQRVSLWGPYQIDRELYDRALAQAGGLESGAVCYKAVDTGYPGDRACNCIHAVGGVAGGPQLLLLSPAFGETASYRVALRFRPWIVDPGCRHDWVASRLGLDAWPLVRRDWEPPRSGPLMTGVRSLFGRDLP
jgi:hypothetical protein